MASLCTASAGPLAWRQCAKGSTHVRPVAAHGSRFVGHTAVSSRVQPRPVLTAGADAGTKEVYNGVYGPWSVEDEDVMEVTLYRAGLTGAGLAVLLCTLAYLLPEGNALRTNIDAIAFTGAGSLGLSLVLIHIYVTPLKRFVQALWAAGTAGGAYIALSAAPEADMSMVDYVISHAGAVWLVGPLFASITGLAFKEGVCYGKAECAALALLTPALLLGHLSGLPPAGAQQAAEVLWAALFTVFSARKYTQAIKDDIGDKSVFTFMKLSVEEQDRVLAELEAKAVAAEQMAAQQPQERQ